MLMLFAQKILSLVLQENEGVHQACLKNRLSYFELSLSPFDDDERIFPQPNGHHTKEMFQ